MENFKLDLSKLTPVAEADRVKGNWYVVADYIGDGITCAIRRFHSGSKDMVQGGRSSSNYSHWFAIPPNLPGFPVQELPDEIRINEGEWEFKPDYCTVFTSQIIGGVYRRFTPKLPALFLPEQTESERREWLKAELEKLG